MRISTRVPAVRGVVATIVTMGLTGAASADPSEDLFYEGKAYMEENRVAEACVKFASSLALVRRGGTLLNLAICREKEGRFATALHLLEQARDLAASGGRSDRAALATERISSVRTKVSWLTVSPAAETELSRLTVQVDGASLPRDLWGIPQAVDSGRHTIVADNPGRLHLEATIVSKEGEGQLVPIGLSAPPRKAEAVSALAIPMGPHDQEATEPRRPAPEGALPNSRATGLWPRILAGTGATLGVVTLVVGGVFGIQAIVDSKESQRLCPRDRCDATSLGYQRNQDARSAALVADIAIPAGALLTAGALYLFLRSDGESATRAAAWVSPESAGLSVGGLW